MPACSVPGCANPADCEVILFDMYPHNGEVFFQRDRTCGFICPACRIANEAGAVGVREPRGSVSYPHTNRHGAQGFTVYRPL